LADSIVDGVGDASDSLAEFVGEETSLGLLDELFELTGWHFQVVDWQLSVAAGEDFAVGLSDDLVLLDVLEGDFVEDEERSVGNVGQGSHGLLEGRSILVGGVGLGVVQEEDTACSWSETQTAGFQDCVVCVVTVIVATVVFSCGDHLGDSFDVLDEDVSLDGADVGLLVDAVTSESNQRESDVVSAFFGHSSVDLLQQVGELGLDGVDGFALRHDDNDVNSSFQGGLCPFGSDFAVLVGVTGDSLFDRCIDSHVLGVFAESSNNTAGSSLRFAVGGISLTSLEEGFGVDGLESLSEWRVLILEQFGAHWRWFLVASGCGELFWGSFALLVSGHLVSVSQLVNVLGDLSVGKTPVVVALSVVGSQKTL